MRCAPRASNGPNHLGLCALQILRNQNPQFARTFTLDYINHDDEYSNEFDQVRTNSPLPAAAAAAPSSPLPAGVLALRLADPPPVPDNSGRSLSSTSASRSYQTSRGTRCTATAFSRCGRSTTSRSAGRSASCSAAVSHAAGPHCLGSLRRHVCVPTSLLVPGWSTEPAASVRSSLCLFVR